MSEHDWPGDGHHHDDDGYDVFEPADPGHDDPGPDLPYDHHDDPVEDPPELPELPDVHEVAPDGPAAVDLPAEDAGGEPVHLGADPDALPDTGPLDVFPPAVDVELPEPVDGFPWIDPACLGVAAPAGDDAEPVTADGLAGYANTELTGDGDPWEQLARSEDPATSALARWWAGPDGGR